MLLVVDIPADILIQIDQTTLGLVPGTEYNYTKIRNLFELNKNRVWVCLAMALSGTFPGTWFLVKQGKWVVLYYRKQGFSAKVRIARTPHIRISKSTAVPL